MCVRCSAGRVATCPAPRSTACSTTHSRLIARRFARFATRSSARATRRAACRAAAGHCDELGHRHVVHVDVHRSHRLHELAQLPPQRRAQHLRRVALQLREEPRQIAHPRRLQAAERQRARALEAGVDARRPPLVQHQRRRRRDRGRLRVRVGGVEGGGGWWVRARRPRAWRRLRARHGRCLALEATGGASSRRGYRRGFFRGEERAELAALDGRQRLKVRGTALPVGRRRRQQRRRRRRRRRQPKGGRGPRESCGVDGCQWGRQRGTRKRRRRTRCAAWWCGGEGLGTEKDEPEGGEGGPGRGPSLGAWRRTAHSEPEVEPMKPVLQTRQTRSSPCEIVINYEIG